MPKFTLLQPFHKFSGASRNLGLPTGIVSYWSNKAGNVARALVTPANPQSESQTLIRGYLAQAAEAWHAITDPTIVTAWNVAAATVKLTDHLGNSYHLSGIDLFVRINSYRLLSGTTTTTTVPALDSTAPATAPVLTKTGTSAYTLVVNTSAMSSGSMVLARLSEDTGSVARQARENECRIRTVPLADSMVVITGASTTINLDWVVGTPAPIAGRVGIVLQSLNSGFCPGSMLFETNVEVKDGI